MKLLRKSRWLNKLYANLLGYFWTSCPICGDYYGGHEWDGGILAVTYNTSKCVCYKQSCIQEANLRNGMNRGIGGKIATAWPQDTACETTRFFTRITKQGGVGDIDYGKAWT